MSVSPVIIENPNWPEWLPRELTLTQMETISNFITQEISSRLLIHPDSNRMYSPIRSKQNAKENESSDVDRLIQLLNDLASPQGARMRSEFSEVFDGDTLLCARRGKAGGRGQHYDFEIQTARTEPTGTWLRVEHKGSTQEKVIREDSKPWEQGVQFHNGGANKYSIAKKYAESWYKKYIESGLLKERYGLTSALPSMEEWIQRDVCVQGDPKTLFGQELKQIYRMSHPGKSLEEERDEFVEEFIHECSPEDTRIFAAEVLPVIQEAFAEKDVWLQIAGNVHTDSFQFRWSRSIMVDRIESVEIHKKSDIHFTVHCNNGLVLKPILRWGKGMGFSNLRIDLK